MFSKIFVGAGSAVTSAALLASLLFWHYPLMPVSKKFTSHSWSTLIHEGTILRPAMIHTKAVVSTGHMDPYKALAKSQEAEPLLKHIQSVFDVEKNMAVKIVASVFRYSEEHRVAPDLVLGIIDRESSFRTNAKSGVGAVGLMQIWPKWHQSKIKEANGSDDSLWEPDFNIRIGTKIFREYLDQSRGNLEMALSRYNGSVGLNNGYSKKVLKSKASYTPYVKPLQEMQTRL